MKFERGIDPKEALGIGWAQIKVVSYSDPSYSRCSTDVTLKLGDREWYMPSGSLSSGGSVSFDKNWSEEVTSGPWTVNEWPDDLPEDARPYALEAINETVPWGCCGGCV